MIVSGFLYSTAIQVGTFGQALPDAFFDELLSHTRKRKASTLAGAVVALFPMGGNIQAGNGLGLDNVLNPAVRTAKYFAIIEARWKDNAGEAGRADAKAWATEASRILAKYSQGSMRHAVDAVNEKDQNVDINAYDKGYPEHVRQKMRDIKIRYDPCNFFSMNANILPAPSSKNK
jgi:hypothetical protein